MHGNKISTTTDIPKFIQIKGCINCEVSKTHKERHGTDYGFDHELISGCIISGCTSYGVLLANPFLDPDKAIRFAEEEGDPTLIEKAKDYAHRTKQRFKRFYQP